MYNLSTICLPIKEVFYIKFTVESLDTTIARLATVFLTSAVTAKKLLTQDWKLYEQP